MKKRRTIVSQIALCLAPALCSPLMLQADWIPSSGGFYNYTDLANWTDSEINNVFLPTSYSGGDQTLQLYGDGSWVDTLGVETSQGDGSALLLKAAGGTDRNLSLGGDVTYVSTGTTGGTLKFGNFVSGENVNFTLPQDVTVNVSNDVVWGSQVVFSGSLSGTGGLTKTGAGLLYLQNSASTFTGTMEVNQGRVYLAGSGATLATNSYTLGRQDAIFDNNTTDTLPSNIGSLVLGNNIAPTEGSVGANADRISDSAVINMTGGNLRLNPNEGDGNSLTETVGTVNLLRNANDIVVQQSSTGTSNVTTLHITNLNRTAGSTLNGFGSGTTSRGTIGTGAALESRITIDNINGSVASSAMVNGIIPWAVSSANLNSYSWTDTSATGDFLTYGANGLTPYTAFVTDLNTASATENVKLTSVAALTSDRTINSLTTQMNSGVSGDFTLTLTSGAMNLMRESNVHGGVLTIAPNIDFNGNEGIVILHEATWRLSGDLSNTGGNGLTISGLGTNNKAVSSGLSVLELVGTNTYSGTTTINGAFVQLYTENSVSPNSAFQLNESAIVNMRRGNRALASLSGYGRVEFDENSSTTTGSTTLTVGSNNTDTTYGGVIADGQSNWSGKVTKVGTGIWTLTGVNDYSGLTTVSAGTLVVNGSIASSSGVSVADGATLSGSGVVSAISGAGMIGPGNSPGILTATSVDLSGGADVSFEFTQTGEATWASATDSGNDVLRLTDGSTPIIGTADSANIINVYFGDYGVYVGGIFTDADSDFEALVSGATYNYFLLDGEGAVDYNGFSYTSIGDTMVSRETVQIATADFSDGDVVNGWTQQFTVSAVPEPATIFFPLATIGAFFYLRRKRSAK